MRLLNLKLHSRFRGLAAGSEFRFDNTELAIGKIEPICLVGLNGSGKSNVLETICEIFYYLETYVLAEGKPRARFQTGFGFEISYKLDITFELANRVNWRDLDKLTWEGTRETIVSFMKMPNELPKTTLFSNGNIQVDATDNSDIFILPNHVIAYSSGYNELISNPFVKSSYHYFQELENKQSKDLNLELGLTRLFHLDYQSSQFLTVCNYLFADSNKVNLISEAVGLEDLDSFSLTIRFHNYRNNKIIFARTLDIAIDNFKSCATAIQESEKELNLGFKIDSELRRAFKRKFGSAILLFRDFFYLNLLNIHLHPVDTRKKIKDAQSMTYDNLSNLIPVPKRDKLVFVMDKVRFIKKGQDEPIKYKNLSDGEHQLMHVLGSIMLLNTSGSILLYDEPETHFNPDWRSQLISLINKAAHDADEPGNIRKQEIIITSHSPFIVSDCRTERVFIFEKGKSRNPEINTYGASVNIITMSVFGKTETISLMPQTNLKKIRSDYDSKVISKEQAIEQIDELGESIEKTLLINYLINEK